MVAKIASSPIVHPRNEEDANARFLCLNTAVTGVSTGGIVAFLPVFLARIGANPTLMSWVTSAPALVASCFLIPGAIVAERSRNQVRVRVIAAQMVRWSFLICALLPFLVRDNGLLAITLLIVWTAKTLPDAVAIPAWTSVMARAISPRRRAQLNGTRWALLSLVTAISSVVFGWLLDHIAFPYNYQLVFFISFALAMLDPYFFSRIRLPEVAAPPTEPQDSLLKRAATYVGPVFRHKPFVLFLMATTLYRVALNMPAPLFTLFWVNELRAPDTLIGLRGTVGYAALMVGYTFWGNKANKFGHRKMLFISAIGVGLYAIMTALSPSAIWLLPAAVVWGSMAAGIDLGLFDLMLECCPGERQPLFAAFWSLAANLAVFIGPLIGARISGVTSLPTALIVAGLAQIVTTVGFFALPKDA
ncbi:MAG: MFS transporter [Chloroflexi bacterium]|nr:MFS transporter [Chloroflexota bacterium]